MASQTVRQLLERIQDFHRQLGAFYEATAEQAARAKAKALLEYMGQHERALQACLADYERDASAKILDTWIQFLPDLEQCQDFDEVEISKDLSVEDVVRMSLRFDDCLIRFYREMAEIAVSQDVKEAFESLARLEEQEERNLTRATLEVVQGM